MCVYFAHQGWQIHGIDNNQSAFSCVLLETLVGIKSAYRKRLKGLFIRLMVGVIDGFRWAILGGESQIYLPGFALSMGLVAVIFVTGVQYFCKMERTFADVI